MAIINTLLTARDNTTSVVNKVRDNVKKATGDMQKNLDSASTSAEHLEGAFDNLRNFDTSSFTGFTQSLRQITQQMDNAEGSAAKFLVRVGLLAGGATAIGYALVSAVNKSSEYVNTMNEAAIA